MSTVCFVSTLDPEEWARAFRMIMRKKFENEY